MVVYSGVVVAVYCIVGWWLRCIVVWWCMTRLVQIGLAGGLAWSPFNVYLLVTTVILFISETLHHHHCTRNRGQK